VFRRRHNRRLRPPEVGAPSTSECGRPSESRSGREEGASGRVHALRLPAVQLGPHGGRSHEPTLKIALAIPSKVSFNPPVQFDLVVQRAEDAGDGLLRSQRWTRYRDFGKSAKVDLLRNANPGALP